MINSITELQRELAELARRRQDAATVVPGPAAPAVAAGAGQGATGLPPGTPGVAAPGVVKGAVPGVVKRKFTAEQRRRLAREGKALANGSYPIEGPEDLEPAAILARSGHGDVLAAERLIARRAREMGEPNPLADDGNTAAEKTAEDRGAREGPGDLVMPGRPGPGDFGRGYLEAGHAADSPQAGPPRANPMPPLLPGVPIPVELPGVPMAARIGPEISSRYVSGSPSECAS